MFTVKIPHTANFKFEITALKKLETFSIPAAVGVEAHSNEVKQVFQAVAWHLYLYFLVCLEISTFRQQEIPVKMLKYVS